MQVQYLFRMALTGRGQEALWREWRGSGSCSREMEGANSECFVARWELIEAHHIEEAVEAARQRFPDFTVMREGSERVSRA